MSIYTEYLKLVPRGLKNIDGVIEGIKNNIKLNNGSLPEDLQEEILKRRLICQYCPFMSENAKTSKEYFELFNEHYNSQRTDEHCSICGCPLSTRTASLSSNCGLEHYNNTHENKIELKWQKIL
jgi:hypothetical protein